MKVLITYNGQLQGHSLFVIDDQGRQREIATLNGNRQDSAVPVVLYSLDAHVVYSLSHPIIISRILMSQPQVLLTSKEIGHRLFEHGMKAALSKQMLGNCPVVASLDTYYKLSVSAGSLSVLAGPNDAVAMVIDRHVFGPKCSDHFVLASRSAADLPGVKELRNKRLHFYESLIAEMHTFSMG